jgi:hypothetical protein
MGNNQNGFSIIEAIVIMVIVILVGITGFYIWHNKHHSVATTKLPYPVTYIKPQGTAAYGDSINANVRILKPYPVYPVSIGSDVKLQAKIIKIFSYQRIEGVTYPMMYEDQVFNLDLQSSVNIGGDWTNICNSGPNLSGRLPCNNGELDFYNLSPSLVTNFISSNENKIVKAELSGGGSNYFIGITGLAN